MSLMDTIKGARQEVNESGVLEDGLVKKRKERVQNGDQDASASSTGQGFTRKSASKAKPRRQQAAGVRVVTSSGKAKSRKDQTKEELKAERKHDREVSDLRYNVSQKLLEQRDEYSKARKLWWKFLIGGVVLMVISVGIYMAVSNMGTSAPEWLAFIGLVVMVGAYVVVIAGFIYDWRVIRPMRKETDAYVQSMSEKRLVTAINKDADKDKKGKGRKGK